MTNTDYLKMLVETLHSIIAATIGHVEKVQTGYEAGENCRGCKLCYSVCPQKCIDISVKPVVIDQNHCLHCGRCAEICPEQCIKKRGTV